MKAQSRYHPIKKLSQESAQKIAAGEIIERPASVIRELLDNAIDSGATKIQVEIKNGGIDFIRVVDNGCGMTKEDVELCTQTHATSKIETVEDLLKLSTLGFRGEALSSIDAVSRLEITSTREGPSAWRYQLKKTIPARLAEGTSVQIENLFENFPARKQFLKRASAEANLCRQIFIDKALPHFETEFTFTVDDSLKLRLPACKNLKQRYLNALQPKEPEKLFHQIEIAEERFSFAAVLGSPDVVRSDKRNIMIFANGRRITEYGLTQAILYGSEGYFPNGAFPIGILFLQVTPDRVDFNIHPAKKEARFQDYGEIHHAVSSAVANFYRQKTVANLLKDTKYDPSFSQELNFTENHTKNQINHAWSQSNREYTDRIGGKFGIAARDFTYSEKPMPSFDTVQDYRENYTSGKVSSDFFSRNILPENSAAPPQLPQSDFKFLGQVAGTFIAVEKNDALYLIDQHAAHERILFNELKQSLGISQELLIPYKIVTESDKDDQTIRKAQEALTQAGFKLIDEGDGIWQVTAVPIRWVGTEQQLTEDITEAGKTSEDILDHILATSACRAACKDGAILDPVTARKLVEKTFALPEPLCPHGRPLWIVIDREELFKRIKRT
ncbi:DNA mismatch repair endonuclease MutL [Treponema phagedenis]|uniref:DNA mismatch repair endonuclease MutL n=1 Tax=Treponema phagedenis TaxID=162 RepID=UPI0001F6403D|nr:DNA mismatch repair endonuclease MutL [Treponema phagedenis]EFW39461.1 DNA mismatch repair domain protein [Treponema phagedenis F0421]TYT79062.1 DNA mismatch repair endonuclease MutL [Treponema phagedenis]